MSNTLDTQLMDMAGLVPARNSTARILGASLMGTTIEFFDFYIYTQATVMVFPHLFFPKSDPTSAILQSFATFSIAFFARPFGGIVFGHFGDKIGRKATLVAALMTMGLSTVAIGCLPTYASIGVFAPLLLALCRLGQGLGLGGEWGGAVLLATENAPPKKRSWYAMFPQLGAPLGLFLSSIVFLIIEKILTPEQFASYGWRIPFLISMILVIIGLYIRLKITETPEFQKAIDKKERVRVPVAVIFKSYIRNLVLGTFVAVATFVLFYLMIAFSTGWAQNKLGADAQMILTTQIVSAICFAATIPLAGKLSDRYGRRLVLMLTTAGIAAFGIVFAPLLMGGTSGLFTFYVIGMALMGFTYGPIGAALAAPFPVSVRYTGSSLTFNLASIIGASLTPFIATYLASAYGLASVGYYLVLWALITLLCLFLSREVEVSN